ncbi:MAG: hypothetical protein ABI795_07065 [Chthoniobacterales bacterium]
MTERSGDAESIRRVSRILLALIFIGAGILHLCAPGPFLTIVPRSLPRPDLLVAISGTAEILGGAGLCFRRTRRAAGVGLMALLVAVFPANLQALSTGMRIGGHAVPHPLLWARLPLQLVLVGWVYWACVNQRSPRGFD